MGKTTVDITTVRNCFIEKNTTYLKNMTVDMPSSKSVLTLLPPSPYCGSMPSHWKDSFVIDATLYGNKSRSNISRFITFKFIGKETVTVKAGKFEASVYEKKQIDILPDNNGVSTFITTTYVVKDIGIVKRVNLFIFKQRKYKKTNTLNKKQQEEYDKKISQGLEDLKNGKDASEIAFFNDTTQKKEINTTDEFDTKKHLYIIELLSYTIR